MLLIGSKALSKYITLNRVPNDTDYICTIEEFEEFVHSKKPESVYPLSGNHMVAKFSNGNIFEFEIAWEGTSAADILNYENSDMRNKLSSSFKLIVAKLDTLLMLKMSHRYLRNSPHFLKTMMDINLIKRQGVQLNPELKKILKKREAETYNYTHPKLNKTKNEFFDDSVQYKYEHDDIHLAVAIGERPAYMEFKPDDSEVLTDMKKFKSLPKIIKLNSVIEEASVLAIERSLVPFPNKMTSDEAFKYALIKLCQSISSGKWREYAYNNFYEVLELFKEQHSNYYDRFVIALNSGLIREYSKDSLM